VFSGSKHFDIFALLLRKTLRRLTGQCYFGMGGMIKFVHPVPGAAYYLVLVINEHGAKGLVTGFEGFFR
jgi:hypothetical protein